MLSELTNRGHNLARVFEDFLSATVCAFSTGLLEERYMEIAGRYGEHMNTMGEALGALVMAMEETGADILGDFFEGAITHGEAGQFFTPEPVCEMIVKMTLGENPPQQAEDGSPLTICDPACGSGRTLLAAGRMVPDAVLYGCDVDHRCVMMTAINLALNYRRGKVVWGNSLSLQEHGHYSIFRFSGLVQVLWSERPVLTVKKAEEMVVIDDDERAEAKKPQQLSLIDVA